MSLLRLGTTVCLASALAVAQAIPFPGELAERGEVALHQALLDAGNDQLALLVASHPDDQYLHPAALLRFRYGWRVAVVLFTRGEGGQNVSGSESGDALAARRTDETERCAARLAISVHYLDRPDGGYCRGAEEALDLWGRVATSNELAKLIRRLRPDLIWTTHHPAEEHGHDLALLRVLPDAIQRASSSRYRWEGLPPFSVPAAIRHCTPDETADFEMPGDGVDPVRGETFRTLAYHALAEHASQAPFRSIDELFPSTLRLRALVEGETASAAIFARRDGLFAELAASKSDGAGIAALRRALEEQLPARVAERGELARLALDVRGKLLELAAHAGLGASSRVARRIAALDAVVVHALSLVVTAASTEGSGVVAGTIAPVALRVANGDVRTVDKVSVRATDGVDLPDGSVDLGPLLPGGVVEHQVSCRLPQRSPGLASAAVPPAWISVVFQFADHEIVWPVPLTLEARAPFDCTATRPSLLWPLGRRSTVIAIRVTNHRDFDAKGTLSSRVPVGWSLEPSTVAAEVVGGASRIFTFTLTAPDDVKPGVTSVRLRFQDVVAEIAVHSVAVAAAPSSVVGLIPGVDDTARQVIEDLGVELHVLDGDDVATFPLDRLNTILVDIRALRVQPTARAAFDRLLRFVERGGRLVVLYHKDKEWDAPGFRGSPYPLRVGRGRVTQEDAPVRILRQGHRLLTWPNRVQSSDWDGWVQERGLYFAEEYDARFEEIVAMADAGMPELRGSLLYATYGKGDYVYCALSLFRQLKALHPGACRLFANLIAPSPASVGR
ncbi:MAG: PIG-L family deacetylase [Planctomycetota bacterium]